MGASTLSENERSHSWMLLPIRASSAQSAQRAIAELEDSGIETRPILTGNFTAQPSLKRILGTSVNPRDFVQAEYVSATSFMVGCHHHFTDEQIAHLAESLRRAAEHQ
jgi:CDP-6-deoxy-D-xylo-4-hexulose-3-dehydrase